MSCLSIAPCDNFLTGAFFFFVPSFDSDSDSLDWFFLDFHFLPGILILFLDRFCLCCCTCLLRLGLFHLAICLPSNLLPPVPTWLQPLPPPPPCLAYINFLLVLCLCLPLGLMRQRRKSARRLHWSKIMSWYILFGRLAKVWLVCHVKQGVRAVGSAAPAEEETLRSKLKKILNVLIPV